MSGPIRPEPDDNWLGEYTRHLAPSDATATPQAPAKVLGRRARSVGPVRTPKGALPDVTPREQTPAEFLKGLALDFAPVTGEARGIQAAHQAYQEGRPVEGAVTAGLSFLPFGGRLVKGLAKEARAANAILPEVLDRAVMPNRATPSLAAQAVRSQVEDMTRAARSAPEAIARRGRRAFPSGAPELPPFPNAE